MLTFLGTVISINENPFPYHSKLDKREQHELDSIRYNSLNVLTQLSQATDQERPLNPIMTVQVRAGRKSSMAESRVSDDDSPSLLLYYLFDDWYTSYSLVAKSDHEYRRQLDVIVGNIKHLHVDLLTRVETGNVSIRHSGPCAQATFAGSPTECTQANV